MTLSIEEAKTKPRRSDENAESKSNTLVILFVREGCISSPRV